MIKFQRFRNKKQKIKEKIPKITDNKYCFKKEEYQNDEIPGDTEKESTEMSELI